MYVCGGVAGVVCCGPWQGCCCEWCEVLTDGHGSVADRTQLGRVRCIMQPDEW